MILSKRSEGILSFNLFGPAGVLDQLVSISHTLDHFQFLKNRSIESLYPMIQRVRSTSLVF